MRVPFATLFAGRGGNYGTCVAFTPVCFTLGMILAGVGASCQAALTYPPAPDGGQKAVTEFVGETLRDTSHGSILRERSSNIADIAIAEPHRWYGVGVKSVASQRLLATATSSSWRYILLHGTNAVGLAQVPDPDVKAGRALKVTGLYETGFSSETLEALRKAARLPQVQKQAYQVRFLEVAGLHFFAVWLHAKGDDIILPLPSPFFTYNAFEPYSEKQILELLQPEAKKKLKAPTESIRRGTGNQ